MQKNLFAPFLWGILASSLLSSCRTEDNLTQRQKEKDMRFAVFVSKEGKAVNYADGFAFLLKRYDGLQKTNLSGINNKPINGTLASTEKMVSISQGGLSYVEFNVKSQIITEQNGDKWIVFPKVQGNRVIGLVSATLTEKGTYVRYRNYNEQDELYKLNVVVFQESLNKFQQKFKVLALNASIKPMAGFGCREENNEWVDCDHPGVDIIVPKPNPGTTNPPEPGGGGGGCLDHANCIDPGYGGGGYIEPIQDPCSKMKSLAENAKFKEKVSQLDNDKVLGYDHEMGNAVGYPPAGTGITETQYPPMDNKPGTTSVSLPDGDNYFGFIHTHNNYDRNGNAPIKIFSPADITTFLTNIVRNAQEYGKIDDAFAMVITSQGNYILKYNGSGDYNIGPNQIKNWENAYIKTFGSFTSDELSNSNIIEKAFAQFLKDAVKVDGLEVYQSDKQTGATSKINADGTKNPC